MKPPALDRCVTMRTSEEQFERLTLLAERLDVSKGEVIRIALDYWIGNADEARRALRRRPA